MGVKRVYLQQNVFEAALERIRWVFSEFKNVYVSCSGGKDSTVTLNLTLRVAEELGRLPVPVLFIDQEAEWQATIDYIRTVMRDPRVDPRWLQVPFRLFNATSTNVPWLHCWDPTKESEWIRPKEDISIKRNVYGVDRFGKLFVRYLSYHHRTQPVASLCGIRCEESPGRMLGLTTAETYKGVTWGCFSDPAHSERHQYVFSPLYDWSYRDIWKAIHDHNWPYCNTAEAPIWMGDYSFKPIADVRLGDEVIGWSDSLDDRRARLMRTMVVGTRSRLAEVVCIRLESGRIIRCTADHQWLRNPHQADDPRRENGNWRFGPARVGDALAFVIAPEAPAESGEGRWLGGIYDWEGSWDQISQSHRKNPEVVERIREALTSLEIPFTNRSDPDEGMTRFRIKGGRPSLVRFVQSTQPTRLSVLDSLILGSRFREKDRVVSIEQDGVEPVYCLQTATGNYVAWGYASKNCKIYNLQYQYGIPIRAMRVSNLHHETAVRSLFYLQEFESETWNKVQRRLAGVNTAGHMQRNFYAPRELPPMFKSWEDYRDYLMENLITEPESVAYFKKMFAMYARLYAGSDEELMSKLWRAQIGAVLVNDTFGTTMGNFTSAHGSKRSLDKWKAKRLETLAKLRVQGDIYEAIHTGVE